VRLVRRLASITLLAYVALIIFLSLLPGPDLPDTSISDKLQHVIAYTLMSALAVIALGLGRSILHAGLLALILSNVVGIGLEFIQPHFGRTFDTADMLANAIGATAGAIVTMIALRLSRSRFR
jgi:VanZ family protein